MKTVGQLTTKIQTSCLIPQVGWETSPLLFSNGQGEYIMKLKDIKEINPKDIIKEVPLLLKAVHELYLKEGHHWLYPFTNIGTKILTVGEIPFDKIIVIEGGNTARYEDLDVQEQGVVETLAKKMRDNLWQPTHNAPPMVVPVMIDGETYFVLVNGHHRYLAWQLALGRKWITEIKYFAAVGYFVDAENNDYLWHWGRYQAQSNPIEEATESPRTPKDDALNLALLLKGKYKKSELVKTNKKLNDEINFENKKDYEGSNLRKQNKLVKDFLKVDVGNTHSYTDIAAAKAVDGMEHTIPVKFSKTTFNTISKNMPLTNKTMQVARKVLNHFDTTGVVPTLVIHLEGVPNEEIQKRRKQAKNFVDDVREYYDYMSKRFDKPEFKNHQIKSKFLGQKTNENKGEIYDNS